MTAGSVINARRCSHGAVRRREPRTVTSNVSAERERGYNLHNIACKKSIEVANATPGCEAFTLAEILVSRFVVGIIFFRLAHVMTSAAARTRSRNKHSESDH